MAKTLNSFAQNVYSQFGEDGIVEKIFSIIGIQSRVAIEFGAWDGLYHSNTGNLWKKGWRTLLIECDPERFLDLVRNTKDSSCICINEFVELTGQHSLDAIAQRSAIGPEIDFLSIDIDGNDYYIFESLEHLRPRLIACEYNPTIPPALSILAEPDSHFGCSALALCDLASRKGYALVAMTDTNCLFVRQSDAHLFAEYATDIATLFPPQYLTYCITNYDGDFAFSQKPPYGLRRPMNQLLRIGTLHVIARGLWPRLRSSRPYRVLRRIYGRVRAYVRNAGKPPHRIKQDVIREAQRLNRAGVLIETGTYLGDMVAAMRRTFSTIHSIELDPKLHERARKRFARQEGIVLHYGDSAEILPKILSDIHEPCVFWLDGHYSGGITARGKKQTPVREELEAILKHPVRNHIILIDDARCFNGSDDYPTIDDLRELVERTDPARALTVANDIIRITPRT